MKKYILLFITVYAILFLSTCTREPNPFSAVKTEPEILRDVYPTSCWKDWGAGVVSLGFFMFEPDYNFKYFDHVLVYAQWGSFPQNINNGDRIEDIYYLWQDDEIKGIGVFENEINLPFGITYSDVTPPNIISVTGPYGETFSEGRFPDIRIVVQETNYSDGLFIERFYSIYMVDVYGNISDVYNRSIKYVNCTIYFADAYTWDNYGYGSYYLTIYYGEVTRVIDSKMFEVKAVFDPSVYLNNWYNGEWVLENVYVYDNTGNTGYSTNFKGQVRFWITR